jgi:hypothetical protein
VDAAADPGGPEPGRLKNTGRCPDNIPPAAITAGHEPAVLLIVGLVALAAAVWLVLARPGHDLDERAERIRWRGLD